MILRNCKIKERRTKKIFENANITMGSINCILNGDDWGEHLTIEEFDKKYLIYDLHKNRITPDFVTVLNPNEYFVFGSNLAGRHGKGAAKQAKNSFGAQLGIGVGYTGNCYAIPTKDNNIKTLKISNIKKYVERFIQTAEHNLNKIHLVTEIGCGLAGYSVEEIAPLFNRAKFIKNIHLPKSFWIEIL